VRVDAGQAAVGKIYDIFEGTEQVQQSVIATAITGGTYDYMRAKDR